MKNMKKIVSFSLGLLLIIAFTACSSSRIETSEVDERPSIDDKTVVAATILPVQDLLRQVGGDLIEVIEILPPGASPHTYDFSPSDIQSLSQAEMVFGIGFGVDDWIYDLVESVSGQGSSEDIDSGEARGLSEKKQKLKVIELHDKIQLWTFDGVELQEGEGFENVDPHYWLDPENARLMAEQITEVLTELDPDSKAIFEKNLEDFKTSLSAVDYEIRQEFDELKSDPSTVPKMLVFHEAWNYYARHYGLDIVGAFALSPGKSVSPKYLKEVYEIIEENDLKVIFAEPQLAEAVLQSVVDDFDLEVFTLDPIGGIDGEVVETLEGEISENSNPAKQDYIDLLLYNAETIQKAFE